jgi:hypothetical protein
MTCIKPREILIHHHFDKAFEADFWLPAQFLPSFRRIAEQVIDLSRPQESWVCFHVISIIHAQVSECDFQELAH